jgi:hypothetical protein
MQQQQWQGVMKLLHKQVQDKAEAAAQQPVMPARQRTTDLTELSVLVVKAVERLYMQQHRQPSGYGRLATDVIRLCKAWARYGMPVALRPTTAQSAAAAAEGEGAGAAAAEGEEAAATAEAAAEGEEAGAATAAGCSSSSWCAMRGAGTAAASFKGPPAYMWEILVLFVLQQYAAQRTFFHQKDPLALFMAVLQEASTLLRTGTADEAVARAVILDMSSVYPGGCSVEAALRFSQSWGSGRVHTPYIINPVDPTFNCTIMQPFRAWDAVADAAGQLYAQLAQAIEGAGGGGEVGSGEDGGGGTATGSGQGESVWRHVLSSSTLGPVWNAFHPGACCCCCCCC